MKTAIQLSRTTLLSQCQQTLVNLIPQVGSMLALMAILLLVGCSGGATKAPSVNAPQTIAFAAARALDGSDALGTPNIWLVNADGSGAVALTRLNTPVPFAIATRFPTWSPDGSKLAFESSRALDGSNAANTNDIVNIWTTNADGSNAKPVTQITATGVGTGGAVWSPDGTRLAYSSTQALDGSGGPDLNSIFNVWMVNADGSGSTPLTKLTAGNSHSIVLGWSVDGKKLIFESGRALDGSDAPDTNRTDNIWTINADGSGASPVTRLTAGELIFDAMQSPDGTRLAIVSDRALDGTDAVNSNGTRNLWVMKADGSGAIPLTHYTAFGGSIIRLVWSPDGGKIAFTSARALDGSDEVNGAINLWTMNSDGTNITPLTRLTAIRADVLSLGWSADGKRLTFESSRALDGSDAANVNHTTNIWIINIDGSNPMPLTRITSLVANNSFPQWKP